MNFRDIFNVLQRLDQMGTYKAGPQAPMQMPQLPAAPPAQAGVKTLPQMPARFGQEEAAGMLDAPEAEEIGDGFMQGDEFEDGAFDAAAEEGPIGPSSDDAIIQAIHAAMAGAKPQGGATLRPVAKPVPQTGAFAGNDQSSMFPADEMAESTGEFAGNDQTSMFTGDYAGNRQDSIIPAEAPLEQLGAGPERGIMPMLQSQQAAPEGGGNRLLRLLLGRM